MKQTCASEFKRSMRRAAKRAVLTALVLLVAVSPAAGQSQVWGEAALKKMKTGSYLDRVDAARKLGKLQYRPAIPALKRALKSDNMRLRIAAAKALLSLGERVGLNMYLAMLSSKKRSELIEALQAMREIGIKEHAAKVAAIVYPGRENNGTDHVV